MLMELNFLNAFVIIDENIMIKIPLTFLPTIILLACSSNDNQAKQDQSLLEFSQYSESVQDTFYIEVQLPREYYRNETRRYKTVYLLDGNFYFPMMASIIGQYEIAQWIEPVILIGVGYKNFKTMDSLRVRDYLYPKAIPSDEIIAAGGGQKFNDFLTTELIPRIDSGFRTEKNHRALLGHSFGGYFVLYSLLRQLENKTHNFSTFISASPVLWYNDFYLKNLPTDLATNANGIKLFVSVGGQEDSVWSVIPVKNLTAEIVRNRVKQLEFKSHVYNHLDHMDVSLLSFTKGLQDFIRKEN